MKPLSIVVLLLAVSIFSLNFSLFHPAEAPERPAAAQPKPGQGEGETSKEDGASDASGEQPPMTSREKQREAFRNRDVGIDNPLAVDTQGWLIFAAMTASAVLMVARTRNKGVVAAAILVVLIGLGVATYIGTDMSTRQEFGFAWPAFACLATVGPLLWISKRTEVEVSDSEQERLLTEYANDNNALLQDLQKAKEEIGEMEQEIQGLEEEVQDLEEEEYEEYEEEEIHLLQTPPPAQPEPELIHAVRGKRFVYLVPQSTANEYRVRIQKAQKETICVGIYTPPAHSNNGSGGYICQVIRSGKLESDPFKVPAGTTPKVVGPTEFNPSENARNQLGFYGDILPYIPIN